MLVHPKFDPIAIHIGSFGIHWYGLMYLTAFMLFLWLGKLRIQTRPDLGMTVQQLFMSFPFLHWDEYLTVPSVMEIPVTLSSAATSPVSVDYRLSGTTAVPGRDFVASAGIN